MDSSPEPALDESCATLPALLRRISTPVRPRLMAYLLALLFVCLLGMYETRRADVLQDNIVPIAPDTHIPPERQTLIPDPDGMRWIVYAQKAWENGSLRLPHWSNEDAYPTGRFVGWSSPPMWWLEGLAYVRHVVSGQDMLCAIDEVSPHYNTFLWIFASLTMGAMCVFAYGWRGALILPVIYAVLFSGKYGVFSPDHHLWILLSALGTLVCLSAPFVHEGQGRVRLWFIGAALFCAFGLWISAPSQALVLIGIFIGFLFIPSEAARKVDASNWRLFGELTALLSLALCWWEFHPEIPMNVELNNPVYAAGALVAGIWFWQMHAFAASGRRWDALEPRALVYSALAMGVILLPMIVYLPYCFSLADPYFSRWEAQIAEEQPIDILGYVTQHGFLFAAVAAGLAGIVLRFNNMGVGLRASLAMLGGLALTYGYFGVSSNRFTEIVLACMAVIVALSMPQARRDYTGWLAVAFLIPLGLGAVHGSSMWTQGARIFGASDNFGSSLNTRIISNHLIELDRGEKGAVLAPSNEANSINYFSRLPVFGTAYWENKDGLYFTYSIYFYEMPEGQEGWTQVRSMLRRGMVRYIVIPKDFTFASSYMIYGQDRITDPQHTFAYYLIHTDKDKFVPWLKLEKDDEKFRIFSVIDIIRKNPNNLP